MGVLFQTLLFFTTVAGNKYFLYQLLHKEPYGRVDKQEKKKLFLCKVVHVREWVYSKYSVCVCVLLVPKDVQIGNWFNWTLLKGVSVTWMFCISVWSCYETVNASVCCGSWSSELKIKQFSTFRTVEPVQSSHFSETLNNRTGWWIKKQLVCIFNFKWFDLTTSQNTVVFSLQGVFYTIP